jgi:hypothetical protein
MNHHPHCWVMCVNPLLNHRFWGCLILGDESNEYFYRIDLLAAGKSTICIVWLFFEGFPSHVWWPEGNPCIKIVTTIEFSLQPVHEWSYLGHSLGFHVENSISHLYAEYGRTFCEGWGLTHPNMSGSQMDADRLLMLRKVADRTHGILRLG